MDKTKSSSEPGTTPAPDVNAEGLSYTAFLYKLIFGGLLAISLILIPVIMATSHPDPLLMTSMIAFAIAIPLLVGPLVVLRFWEQSGFKMPDASTKFPPSGYVFGTCGGCLMVMGILAALVGITIVFWHASWVLGTAFLSSMLVSIIVFTGLLNLIGRYISPNVLIGWGVVREESISKQGVETTEEDQSELADDQ